jgi:hypothetical protein
MSRLRGERSRGLLFEFWGKRSTRGRGENYLGGEKEARGGVVGNYVGLSGGR